MSTTDLKLWTDGNYFAIAKNADEAKQLTAEELLLSDDDINEFYEWPYAVINWHDECGIGEGIEMPVVDLIAKGKGWIGSTEC